MISVEIFSFWIYWKHLIWYSQNVTSDIELSNEWLVLWLKITQIIQLWIWNLPIPYNYKMLDAHQSVTYLLISSIELGILFWKLQFTPVLLSLTVVPVTYKVELFFFFDCSTFFLIRYFFHLHFQWYLKSPPHPPTSTPPPTHSYLLALVFPCTEADKVCLTNGPLFPLMAH
jgi:hypothetical protein